MPTANAPLQIDHALWTRAKAAKAYGRQEECLHALDQLLELTPDDSAVRRMRQTVLEWPDLPFTYTRVLDFLISRNMGFHEYFAITERLIRQHGARHAVELGVLNSYHAQHLLEACPELDLTGVDAYGKLRVGNGYDDMSQEWFDDLCRKVRTRLEPTGRWHLMRMTTAEAARQFTGRLDFIFIDADHGYDGVKEDIANWYPHVRSGGILAGHDYDHPQWPGVRQAVSEMLPKWGLQATVERGHVWWVRKK